MSRPPRCALLRHNCRRHNRGCPAPAAADNSAWDGDARAGIRLIAGGGATEKGETVLRAGVEIRLAPGWKTYWRYPGDSGVPPHFDFGKSENVKSVTVAWPAPQRLVDSEGITIGYKNSVLFPLRIVPEDASKPVRLRLKLDYAICEKLCVPAQGQSELVDQGRRRGRAGDRRGRKDGAQAARRSAPRRRSRSRR